MKEKEDEYSQTIVQLEKEINDFLDKEEDERAMHLIKKLTQLKEMQEKKDFEMALKLDKEINSKEVSEAKVRQSKEDEELADQRFEELWHSGDEKKINEYLDKLDQQSNKQSDIQSSIKLAGAQELRDDVTKAKIRRSSGVAKISISEMVDSLSSAEYELVLRRARDKMREDIKMEYGDVLSKHGVELKELLQMNNNKPGQMRNMLKNTPEHVRSVCDALGLEPVTKERLIADIKNYISCGCWVEYEIALRQEREKLQSVAKNLDPMIEIKRNPSVEVMNRIRALMQSKGFNLDREIDKVTFCNNEAENLITEVEAVPGLVDLLIESKKRCGQDMGRFEKDDKVRDFVGSVHRIVSEREGGIPPKNQGLRLSSFVQKERQKREKEKNLYKSRLGLG